MSKNDPAERAVRDIRRKTRKQYSAEEKIRIVVSGLRGEDSIAELCRREGIAESLYYSWSKEFLEAGKKRLSGDTARQASSGEVKDLRREMHDLKEALAEQVLDVVRRGILPPYWGLSASKIDPPGFVLLNTPCCLDRRGGGDAGCGDDCADPSGSSGEGCCDQEDRPGFEGFEEHGAQGGSW